MGSVLIADLVPSLQDKYAAFDAEMKARNITYKVTCTSRSVVEQMALYVMGRLSLVEVNRFRWMAGLWLLADNDNKKVTWTLSSKHVTNMFDKDLNNDLAHAFDIVILNGRDAVWDLKADVNANEISDYEEAGQIGEVCGLVWGGRWKNADYVHFEENV